MKHYRFLLIILIALLALAVLPIAAQDTVEANKAVVTRYIEEIFNGGNTDLMLELFSDDFRMHDAMYATYFRGSYAAGIQANHTPPSDIGMSNYVLIGQGDLVAELYTFGGTKQDRPVATPSIDLIRLKNGKITEMWSVWDGWLWLLQPFPDDRSAVPDGWFPVPSTTSTTPEENTALTEQAIGMWQTGNTHNIADVYADDLVFHLPLSISAQLLDRDGVAAYIAWLHTAMPDFTIDTEDSLQVTEGNLAVYYYKWRGRISGELAGRTRHFSLNAESADLYRIEDGKIAEVWWNWYARNFYQFNWFAPPTQS